MPPPTKAIISPLPPFQPDLYIRAWSSHPHPTLPLIATTHDKSVTIFSLSTLSKHSSLTGGHSRSIRSAAWQPSSTPSTLKLVTGSFDATAGIWTYDQSGTLEKNVSAEEDEWEFNLVLEGHENEIKSVAFSPTGQFLATCSRDKSVWIWEEVEEEEWETVAVLSEHEGDVKFVSWMPEYKSQKGRRFGEDCLVSASYDDTVRVWREDMDGEWVCVCVLTEFGGTVWAVEWEKEKEGGEGGICKWRFITACQDGSVKVWQRKDEPEGEEKEENKDWSIPNRMRRELREEWICVGELPRVHEREVYSVCWNKKGVVATTGGDGKLVLYGEDKEGKWKVLGQVEGAHGDYEVNHVVWCRRWDGGRKGEEEMLVSTGDDGVVRGWEVKFE
ncbi:putative cytosolic iron-sulfur protein assembly protein 1 [Podospora fimiseda]|uniref:Probable cytosolic iron-sulfur protein assembly protein 1 n=1 Tax=Podospora fimiseda TaxID=252190 RepID=A0AAN7BG73_9PEZI|nr:putative cytosolic iron-sulfur protein assembly protein 1 [Podospora fimiseda]